MNRFNNKSIPVSGGSCGISVVAAKAFAAQGAHVVITGCDTTALFNARSEPGPKAIALRNGARWVEQTR